MLLQEHYVEKLLKKFGHYDVTPSTPCNAITQLRKNIGYLVDQFEYAHIMGSLMHLSIFFRDLT